MKKFLAILALSTALTVVPATPAKAAAFIGGVVAFAATPIGGFIINAGIGLALSLGGPLIADWLGLDKGDQAETHESLGARTVATVGENIPRSFLYGHAATGGHFLYHNAWSGTGQTPNNHYVQVFSLGDLPISEYKQLWGDKKKRSIDWGSSTSKGYPVEESLVNGRYNQWAIFRDGTDATADAYLLDKFGADPDYPWTAKMIGVGVPMIIITTRLSKGFFDGTPHEFFHEVEGASFHDLREDISMGGAGTHVYGTENTYETTRNNMVIASNVVRGITYNGRWLYGGQNVGPWRTPAAAWMAAANACDNSVSKKGGGTQPRFEIGGEISVDQPPLRFLEEIMKSSTGRMAEVAGSYIPTIGGGGSSVYGFSEKDFVITRDQSAEYLAGLENKFNAYTLVYPEPKKAWNDRTVHRIDAGMVASDGGRTLPVEIRLPLVNDGSRAQRIATGVKREGRRVILHSGVLPFNAFTLTPNDIVSFTHSKFQYTNKKFRVVTKGQPAGFLSPVVLKEVDPDDLDVYDPEADEEDFAAEVLTTKNAATQSIVAFSAVPSSKKDAASNDRLPSVLLGWAGSSVLAADLDDIDGIKVKAVLKSSGKVVMNEPMLNWEDGSANISSSELLARETYEFYGQYFSYSGREFDWAGPIDVEMWDIGLSVLDLGTDLANAHGLVTGNSTGDIQTKINELLELEERLALTMIELNATSKERLDVLQVQSSTGAAAIIRNEKVIVEESLARASSIEQVLASLGESIADGFLQFESEVDPQTSTATITAKVRATAGGNLSSQAAWIISATAKANGNVKDNYFGVFADAFYFFSDDGTKIGAPFKIINDKVQIDTAVMNRIESGNGVSVWDLDTGSISITVNA